MTFIRCRGRSREKRQGGKEAAAARHKWDFPNAQLTVDVCSSGLLFLLLSISIYGRTSTTKEWTVAPESGRLNLSFRNYDYHQQQQILSSHSSHSQFDLLAAIIGITWLPILHNMISFGPWCDWWWWFWCWC